MIDFWLNVHSSAVFTGPSVSVGRREDFGSRGVHYNLETRAHLSLRDSTCPNPKCSSHSSSIPRLCFLSAAPGVLATPHLLSQTERGGLKARPPEDGSCRPRWLGSRSSLQTANYSERSWSKCKDSSFCFYAWHVSLLLSLLADHLKMLSYP